MYHFIRTHTASFVVLTATAVSQVKTKTQKNKENLKN